MSFNDQVSDYEKQRLLNIERNKKYLDMLNINHVSFTNTPTRNNQAKRKKSTTPKSPNTKKPKFTLTPLRMSLRRRGGEEESELFNAEALENEAENPEVEEKQIDRSGPISINDIFTHGADLEQGNKFIETVLEANPISNPMVVSENSSWVMKKWKRVVPNRIFSMDIHPTLDKLLICTGDKDGVMGFWDADRDPSPDPTETSSVELTNNTGSTCVLVPHTKAISYVVFARHAPNKLYSTSFDGQFRCIDLNHASTLTEQGDKRNYQFDLIHSSKSMLSSCSFVYNSDRSWISNNFGEIISLDMRTSESTSYPVHYKKTTSVVTHPFSDTWVVTSSLDGHVKIFDVRKMVLNEETQMIEPIQMVKYKDRVWNVSFSHKSGDKMIVNSNENIVEIWSKFPGNIDLAQKPENVVRISHNNQTGKWISSFRPMWDDEEERFLIGNLNRGVEIFTNEGECKNFLKHPELSTIPSLNMWKRGNNNIIATGTASGVYIWEKTVLLNLVLMSSNKSPEQGNNAKLAKFVGGSSEKKTQKIVISKSKLASATKDRTPKKEEPIEEDEIDLMELEDDSLSDDEIDVESEGRKMDATRMTSRQRAMVLGEMDEPLYSLANYKEGTQKAKSKPVERTRNMEERRLPSAQSMKEIEEVINQLLCVSSDKKDKVEPSVGFDQHSTHNRWTSNPSGNFVSFSDEEFKEIFGTWSKSTVDTNNV